MRTFLCVFTGLIIDVGINAALVCISGRYSCAEFVLFTGWEVWDAAALSRACDVQWLHTAPTSTHGYPTGSHRP